MQLQYLPFLIIFYFYFTFLFIEACKDIDYWLFTIYISKVVVMNK